jgi:hypothetical protein
MNHLHNDTTFWTSFLFDDAENLLESTFKYHNFLNLLKSQNYFT